MIDNKNKFVSVADQQFRLLLVAIGLIFSVAALSSCLTKKSVPENHGVYFSKKEYVYEALPQFEKSKNLLPQPIIENQIYNDMYWKCWEIAFEKMTRPKAGSPFVSNWMDEAFSPNIFQWDTIFVIMYGRYGDHIFPAIESLDNFYRMQRESGYICRELRERDGIEVHFDHPHDLYAPSGRRNSINPPVFSWAEVESYKVTGDKSRFEAVLPVLEKYAQWLNKNGDPAEYDDWENQGRRSHESVHSLYWNTPLGCGMDNSPRPIEYGMGWIDMSSQMVLQYRNLAVIAREIGEIEKAVQFEAEADAISDRINKWCWSEEDGFYYDVSKEGKLLKKKTAASFWPLLAGVASPQQAEKIVAHLMDEKEFWRPFIFPTLSADEPEYVNTGGYWNGGVWAPTNLVAIKGLERNGYEQEARLASVKYLDAMGKVFEKTKTVWENYAPEKFIPGIPAKGDFVGWTGVGPISLLIENILGFRPDGVNRHLTWHLTRTDRHGIEKLSFGGIQANLICEKRDTADENANIVVVSNKPFLLTVVNDAGFKSEYKIKKGNQRIVFKAREN